MTPWGPMDAEGNILHDDQVITSYVDVYGSIRRISYEHDGMFAMMTR